MKLELSLEGAAALREFAEAMPLAIQMISDRTNKLIATYNSVRDEVGPHSEQFLQMLQLVMAAEENAAEAIKELPIKLNATADKIEAFIARSVGN